MSRLDDIRMNEAPVPAQPEPSAGRAEWLRVLARATPHELAARAAPVLADHRFETLRAPEHGLMMVRARIGNSGDRFNVGEVTVSRCAVRYRACDDLVLVGVGHVLGRDEAHAECIARLDALLQHAPLWELLMRSVVTPLRDARQQRDRDAQSQAEATRVRFFALQPEATT